MSGHPSLAQIQQQFAAALLHPANADGMTALFNPHPFLDDRLALYRGNLTAIWQSALQNAFPVLYQLVGEEYFQQVARAFGRAYPSESGDLHHFGARLAEFLKTIPDAEDYPYFSDLAALEWQIHLAYYADDAQSLSLPGLLQTIASEGLDLQSLQFEMHPAFSLYSSEFATVAIWQSHQPGVLSEPPKELGQACRACIFRQHWFGQVQALDEAAWLSLRALQQGVSLGVALEAALECDAGFDINSHLQSWFAMGIFKKLQSPDKEL